MISVLFFATIRDFTKERETTVQDERSLGDLLSRLCERYGDEFRRELLDETGTALSDRVIVLVNGRHTANTGGLETPLRDGDTVAVFPIIGGG